MSLIGLAFRSVWFTEGKWRGLWAEDSNGDLSPAVTLVDSGGNSIITGGIISVSDVNNAPAKSVTLITVGGAAVASGRAISIISATGGNAVVNLAGGQTNVPISFGTNQTILPLAVTQVVSSTDGAATFYNLV